MAKQEHHCDRCNQDIYDPVTPDLAEFLQGPSCTTLRWRMGQAGRDLDPSVLRLLQTLPAQPGGSKVPNLRDTLPIQGAYVVPVFFS